MEPPTAPLSGDSVASLGSLRKTLLVTSKPLPRVWGREGLPLAGAVIRCGYADQPHSTLTRSSLTGRDTKTLAARSRWARTSSILTQHPQMAERIANPSLYLAVTVVLDRTDNLTAGSDHAFAERDSVTDYELNQHRAAPSCRASTRP